MPKRKQTPKADPLDDFIDVSKIARDPETLAKIGAQWLDALAGCQEERAAAQAEKALEKAGEPPKRRVTAHDLKAISNRLRHVENRGRLSKQTLEQSVQLPSRL